MTATRANVDWEQIHFGGSTIVDLHIHPSLKVSLFHRLLTARLYSSRAFDPFGVRADFPKLKEGGMDVFLSTIYAPEKGILEECKLLNLLRFFTPLVWKKVFRRPYFDVTMQMLDEMEKVVEKAEDPKTGRPLAKVVTSAPELDAVLAQGDDRPLALIHAVEGGHSLDGSLDNLQRLFDRGVAYLTLAHFFENEIVYPCYPWPESIQKLGCFQGERNVALGLKPFGEQVVEKMVDLGMLIDVAHCTPSARARIYDIVGSRAPLIASHVGAYEINPSPYNLKDWEIKRIADGGGIVGVIFMNYWLMPHETKRGLDFIARTLEHFVNVGGIDHVGIGTDFDGFTDPPDDLKDAAELPKLTQRLLAEDYSPEAIGKIWGDNALRVLRHGWGKRA
jgi:membrane dipeptidase